MRHAKPLSRPPHAGLLARIPRGHGGSGVQPLDAAVRGLGAAHLHEHEWYATAVVTLLFVCPVVHVDTSVACTQTLCSPCACVRADVVRAVKLPLTGASTAEGSARVERQRHSSGRDQLTYYISGPGDLSGLHGHIDK